MIKIEDADYLKLIPPNLQNDINIRCFAYCFNKQFKRLIFLSKTIHFWSNKDTWNDNICDNLAAELRTPYYNSNLDLDIKKELIFKTLSWFMRLGTPDVVIESIDIIAGKINLVEWFETGCTPYTFKIKTSDLKIFEKSKQILDGLDKVKNVRSHFDGYIAEFNTNIYVGAMATIATYIDIFPFIEKEYHSEGEHLTGAKTYMGTTLEVMEKKD